MLESIDLNADLRACPKSFLISYFVLFLLIFLVKLFEIYPDIPHNFTKKALKICQNLKLKKIGQALKALCL